MRHSTPAKHKPYLEDDLRGGCADERRCDMDDGIDA